jgi:hypothetical protein
MPKKRRHAMPTFLGLSRGGGSDLRLDCDGFSRRCVVGRRSVTPNPSVCSNTILFSETGWGHAMPFEAHAPDFDGGGNSDTIVGVGDGAGEGIETERARL